jgi:hypothetical protein
MYVGFAAGYLLITAIQSLSANLFTKLGEGNIIFVIPLILSIMLYSRYVQQVSWLNRYPIVVMVGVGTAVSMRTIIFTMFTKQISSTFINPFATGDAVLGTVKTPINNILIILIVIASTFFFVFWEMKWMQNEAAKQIRQVGLTSIMLSFGVLIGYSLIMRVARLGARFFYILSPENQTITAIFAILGIISLALSRDKT